MPVGRDHRGLGVAVAVLLAELERRVPGAPARGRRASPRGQEAWSSGTGLTAERLVAVGLAVGGAAVVADDAQHVRGVLLVAGEGAELRAISAEVV